MKKLLFLFLLFGLFANGQNPVSKELSYNEFIGYVKKFHPLVKNANLEINKALSAAISLWTSNATVAFMSNKSPLATEPELTNSSVLKSCFSSLINTVNIAIGLNFSSISKLVNEQ